MRHILCIAAVAVALTGCANRDPRQEAQALNDLYQAVAEPAARCVETPECKAKAGVEIKAADAVAFPYVEQTTQAAIAYDEAPDDQKPAKLGTFDKVLILGQGAVEALAKLLKF